MKNLSFIFLLASLLLGGNEETSRTITGVVMDDTSEPLIGANVVVDGDEDIGTVTEFDGTFSLDVPETAKALKINYTGFNDKIISIEGLNYIKVNLEENQLLEEQIKIKFQSKKIDSTDCFPIITPEEMDIYGTYIPSSAPKLPISDNKTH